MDTFVKLQPAQFCDQIVDGRELYKTPYPLCFGLDGKNVFSDFWRHNFARVVGFVRDLAEQRVDVYWTDLVRLFEENPASDPFQQVVGMYLVYQDAPVTEAEEREGNGGQMGAYLNAIDSVEIMRAPSQPPAAPAQAA